ncbi:mitosis inhibitor protein kinase swe1, partial [Spiromyces aspiralis]
HRNPSLESLKLSKKVHVGGVDCDDLLSTPLSSVKHRGRNNTLVEEYPDSTHSCCSASGGGGGGNDDGGGGSSSISSGLCLTGVKATNLYSQPPPGFHIPAKGKVSESPSSSYIKRSPLSPPSFSLVVGSGDTGAASTSNTNANDFFLDPNTLHRNLLSRRCPGGDDDDDNGDAASETDSTFSSSSTLHPNPRRDGGGPIGPGQPGDSPDGKPGDDLCDSFMFCDSENMQMTTSPVVSDSPKILPTERPQMPQIINGYATNYPHFLRPSYFARNARGPHQFTFLAPPEQLSVEGLGYLEYFEQQFDSLGRIGSGAFSQVYSVRSLDDGSVYAVKKTKTPFEGRKDRQTRLEEVQIMWAVADCPNCVRLVDAWEQYGHLYLQTELCERGTLEQLLDQEADDVGDIETRAWQVLSSIGKGLSRLHSLDIIHLDMKPSNILIGNDGVLKLGDFGHATRLPVRKDKDLEGDREYLAPELLSGSCSKASDVYSLGLILLEIVANIVLPDNGPEWRRLRQGDFSDAHLDALPISPDLRNTIISMLNPDPVLRPSIDAVIAHPKCRTATNILHPL